MSGEAYSFGTDFGFVGGDMTAHVISRRLDDGTIAVMLSFAHDPKRPCDLCALAASHDLLLADATRLRLELDDARGIIR